MTYSVTFSQEDATMIKEFAASQNMTIAAFLRACAIDRIEDEFDLKAYREAADYNAKHPEKFTMEEVKRTFGLQ